MLVFEGIRMQLLDTHLFLFFITDQHLQAHSVTYTDHKIKRGKMEGQSREKRDDILVFGLWPESWH